MILLRSTLLLCIMLCAVSLSYGQCASFNARAFADPIVCNGDNNGRITIQVRNADFFPPYEYSVQQGADFYESGSASGKIYNDLPPGIYSVKIKNNLGSVCDLGNFEINEPPPVNLVIEVDPPLCGNNGQVCAVATGGNIEPDEVTGEYDPDLYFYIWNVSPGPPTISTNRCIRNIGGGNYKVTVSDNRGCLGISEPEEDVIAQDTFRVRGGPDVLVNYGDSVLLESYVDFDAEFTNPLTIQWNPLTNISRPNDSITYVKPCEPTEYIVSMKSNDVDLECFDTTSIFVDVFGEFAPWAPNAFTPNGIGPSENEFFRIYGRGIVELELSIYDRRGALMFTTDDVNEGWDGLINGNKEASTGTYLYVARATSICGEVKAIRGDFTLLR